MPAAAVPRLGRLTPALKPLSSGAFSAFTCCTVCTATSRPAVLLAEVQRRRWPRGDQSRASIDDSQDSLRLADVRVLALRAFHLAYLAIGDEEPRQLMQTIDE
jgi:hypothetical protein